MCFASSYNTCPIAESTLCESRALAAVTLFRSPSLRDLTVHLMYEQCFPPISHNPIWVPLLWPLSPIQQHTITKRLNLFACEELVQLSEGNSELQTPWWFSTWGPFASKISQVSLVPYVLTAPPNIPSLAHPQSHSFSPGGSTEVQWTSCDSLSSTLSSQK